MSLTARYEATTGRPARGWLIVVVPTDVTDDQRQEMSRVLNRAAHPLARITVLADNELWRISEQKARTAVKSLSRGAA